jgi:heme-degrading monooxygenase HmoA
MENYIVQVVARAGHENEVTQFYADLEPALREAKGFRGRKVYRGQMGTMAKAVRSLYSAEELAKHAEPPHEHPGTQFVIVEQWDSVDDRMQFSKNVQSARTKELIPHLLPDHSHEFFEEVSCD